VDRGFRLHFSLRDPAPVLSAKAPPPSPEAVAELRQQQRMLAELIGPAELRLADRQRDSSPSHAASGCRFWRLVVLESFLQSQRVVARFRIALVRDVSRAKAAAARRKTLRMHEGNRRSRQRLGVRQSSGALERAHICRTKLINENCGKIIYERRTKKHLEKSWTLPGLFLAWLILIVATMAIFELILFISNDSGGVPVLLVLGAVTATLFLAYGSSSAGFVAGKTSAGFCSVSPVLPLWSPCFTPRKTGAAGTPGTSSSNPGKPGASTLTWPALCRPRARRPEFCHDPHRLYQLRPDIDSRRESHSNAKRDTNFVARMQMNISIITMTRPTARATGYREIHQFGRLAKLLSPVGHQNQRIPIPRNRVAGGRRVAGAGQVQCGDWGIARRQSVARLAVSAYLRQ